MRTTRLGRTAVRTPGTSRKLQVEQLEDRRLLSASRLLDLASHLDDASGPAAAEVAPAPTVAESTARMGTPAGVRELKVLTWNLYLGADLGGLLEAIGGGGNVVEAVQEIVASVIATNFVERADAMADQIAAAQPDLIGLQEAVQWSIPIPDMGLLELDFREILLGQLEAAGLDYEIVADTTETDINLMGIGFTDHDILLARTDAELEISNVREENFHTNLEIPLPPEFGMGESMTFLRGWNSVDVDLRGARARVVNTHLEIAQFAPIQVAQTVELLCAATKTHLPVILIGDLNSSADPGGPNDTLSYEILRLAGFRDAWSRSSPGDPGDTCCQAADLKNEASTLNDRIDFVLTRGGVAPKATDLLGESEADRTASGLWPSDHAGVAADLQLRARKPWFCRAASRQAPPSRAVFHDARMATAVRRAAAKLPVVRSRGRAVLNDAARGLHHHLARRGIPSGGDVLEAGLRELLTDESLLDLLAARVRR